MDGFFNSTLFSFFFHATGDSAELCKIIIKGYSS